METSDMQDRRNKFRDAVKNSSIPGKLGLVILAVIIVVVAFVGLLETNGAGYITVKQSMLTGKVSIISEPGIFCQCFGRITKYNEAGTIKFVRADVGPDGVAMPLPVMGKVSGSKFSKEIEVRFNDGGLGWISGMVLFDLPKDMDGLGLIHRKFRSFRNLMEAGIMPTVEESVILTAALMSSGESYTTRRATFSEWARDQLSEGTYVTEETAKEGQDFEIGAVIDKSVVKIKMADNNKLRNESPLERYGIKFKQFQITDIRYEPETENIIKTKREALQQTIAAKIAAMRAVQERLAAEELGKKEVKIAEYEALVKKKRSEVEAEEAKEVAVIMAEKELEVGKIRKDKELRMANKKVEIEKLNKAKALIEAEKMLAVAKLNAKSAERNKVASIFEGQGLGEKRRLIYNADGALQQKLDAYVKVMTVLAKELGKQKWVPEITMNGGGKGSADGNAAMNFMNLWMMKTAKELGLDMKNDRKKR